MEENKIAEQELFDRFIDERVNMILIKLDRNKSEEEHNKIIEAERIIDNLPEYEKRLIENYVNDNVELLAQEEPYLYKQGFLDGVRVMKKFMKL